MRKIMPEINQTIAEFQEIKAHTEKIHRKIGARISDLQRNKPYVLPVGLSSKSSIPSNLEEITFRFLTSIEWSLYTPIDIHKFLERLLSFYPSLAAHHIHDILPKIEAILLRLHKLCGEWVISLKDERVGGRRRIVIEGVDVEKLKAALSSEENISTGSAGILDGMTSSRKSFSNSEHRRKYSNPSNVVSSEQSDIDELLAKPSYFEKEYGGQLETLWEIINQPTAKDMLAREMFRSHNSGFREFCRQGTKDQCKRKLKSASACNKLHFRRILRPYTEVELGDCSYLNTCHRMDTCKYVHYELDDEDPAPKVLVQTKKPPKPAVTLFPPVKMLPPQWINCDVRKLDFKVLGKFSVIMADPPWDIHMTLPYGTMTDDEMKALPMHELQDEGLLFLWVTGRAMELGRECMMLWGYDRVDELVWIKTNQLQRLIRTGRTGHWLNHSKEHCLVGLKGNPRGLLRGLDCDVIVGEVRETSRKPDEVYGLIDRLSPGTRKLEIFGRQHNTRPGWITLGNQLESTRIYEADLVKRFNERFPENPVSLTPLPPEWQ
ncbi:uncharacterized protein VTP21DRAFT_5223 [Calcarisporiella thermophila]|uniref:uncharacterized protein n=1 Tax=Calcarisporiella thermophila TaxID=911321 RepID=UPI003742D99B